MTDFKAADHPRVTDGTFTEKAQTAPEFTLEPTTSNLNELSELFFDHGYEGVEALEAAEQALANGRNNLISEQYIIDYQRTRYELNPDGRYWLPNAATLHDAGFTPQDMADLFNLDKGRYRHDIYSLLAGSRIDAARIQHLTSLGVPAWTSAVQAFGDADDPTVTAWLGAVKGNHDFRLWVRRWQNVCELRESGITPKRAVEYATAGASPDFIATHWEKISPGEVRAFATESGLQPGQVNSYLAHNFAHAGNPRELISAARAGELGEIPAAI